MNTSLFLPSLFGKFNNWPYYQTTMSIKDIVTNLGNNETPNFRVKTPDEVEVIYSQKGVNNLLQRALDYRRLEPIKKFIEEQPDSYINNLTIAIFGGEPEWIPMSLSRSSSFDVVEENDDYDRLSDTIGVIKLNGNETLFVLDGQHRLKALRLAYIEKPEIGDFQVGITLIAHIDDEPGKKKTRRLFSIINRHAKAVSLGENILLDEDDLSAILTRILIEEYQKFNLNQVIALKKTPELKFPADGSRFSSVIALYKINELIIPAKEIYPEYIGSKSNLVRIRPNDSIINEYKSKIFNFWDLFFQCFPKANSFVNDPASNQRIGPGAFSLRPIGQQIFCELYMKLKELNRENEIENLIKLIPDDLSDPFWHFVLYNPSAQTVYTKKSHARDYIFYHLGIPLREKQINKLIETYRILSQRDDIELPTRLIVD